MSLASSRPRRQVTLPLAPSALLALPADVIQFVIAWLSPANIVCVACVCHSLRPLAFSNQVWAGLVIRARHDKETSTHPATTPLDGSWRLRYMADRREASRTLISEGELANLSWTFRFKRRSGWDRTPCRVVFYPDHSLVRYDLSIDDSDPSAAIPLDTDLDIHWRITKSRDGVRGTTSTAWLQS